MSEALTQPRTATWIDRITRFAMAFGMTLILVVFLVVMRWGRSEKNVLVLRSVQGTDTVAPAQPPPPPPESPSEPPPPPPPPPATMELPQIDLSVDVNAPPIKAAMAAKELNFKMKPAKFAPAQPQTKARSLYTASELDGQPRRLNDPRVTYPAQLKRQGILEGKVTLEVLINVAGRVTIRRVVSCSHPDFIPMAKSYANQTKFTSPKKDGRIVNAVFNWPLKLRP